MTWVQNHLANIVEGELGYAPGYFPDKGSNKYDTWYGKTGISWCVAGTTWAIDKAFGTNIAYNLISHQNNAPNKRGWSWTVGLRECLMENGTKINPRDMRTGDLIFYKYGKGSAPVDHVNIAIHAMPISYICYGFNVPNPATKGDPLSERGVYEWNFRYDDKSLVDVWRIDWSRYPGIGYIPVRNVDEIQKIVSAKATGVYDVQTRSAVTAYQQVMQKAGYYNGELDGLWGQGTDDSHVQYSNRKKVTVVKFNGESRFHTAVLISQHFFPKGSDVVWLATGNEPWDAMAAGAVAKDGPLLLVRSDVPTLPRVVAQEIARLKPSKIYVAGGVVSDEAVAEAERLARG